MNKRANIYDIADAAGVSISMVSRVVNKSGYVAEEKRERVEAVMKELDYRPRHAARSLASNSHNTIGIVVNYGWAAYSQLVIGRILEGVSGWCRESNRHLTLLWGNDDNLTDTIRDAADQLDGLLLFDIPMTAALHDELKKTGKPFVLINESGGRFAAPAVLCDNRTGGTLAIEHFVEHGHKHVMLLNGSLKTHSGVDRRTGAIWGLEAIGAEVPSEWDIDTHYDPDVARAAVRDVFSKSDEPKPTAIFAASDVMAFGAVDELRALGISVPDQVSVIGFDDSMITPLMSPALTSIRQPLEEMGRRASDMLAELIAGNTDVSTLTLPVEVVSRASVAEAP